MATNDFNSVAAVLADDFVLEWPQTCERIRGAENFIAMNRDYPAHGVWRFNINRLVGDDQQVVSDVTITDGVQQARALSFFTVQEHRIVRLVEFWPTPHAAPAHRTNAVEPCITDFFAM